MYSVARRGTSLIEKSEQDYFRTKGFIRILDGFFLKTKGFLPKVYKIFGSEMPLVLWEQWIKLNFSPYLGDWDLYHEGWDPFTSFGNFNQKSPFLAHFSIKKVHRSFIST